MSDMVRCINCKHLERDGWCGQTADSLYEHDERRCDFFQAATKGDCLRRMKDAELARFLCDISSCRNCMAKRCCGAGKNGFLDWLKEESNGQK